MPVALRSSTRTSRQLNVATYMNSQVPQASLLGIPVELRLRIYRDVVESVPNYTWQHIPVGPVFDNDTTIYKVSSTIRKEVLPFGDDTFWARPFVMQEATRAIHFLDTPVVMQNVQILALDRGDDFEHFDTILDKAALCPKISEVSLSHGHLGARYRDFDDFDGIEDTELEDNSYIAYFEGLMGLPRSFEITLDLRYRDYPWPAVFYTFQWKPGDLTARNLHALQRDWGASSAE